MNFVQIFDFDWLPWQPKFMLNFRKKNIFKSLLRSHKGDEAETLHKCLCYYSLNKLCFYCFCACDFVAMAKVKWEK